MPRAVIPQPASADEVLLHATGLREVGRLGEAAAMLSEFLRQHGHAHACSYQLALIEAERGHWVDAEALARAAAGSGGDEYASGLGQILAKTGKYEEARRWLLRALTLNSSDADALACLGAIYGEQRKLDEALVCIDQALSIRPDFPSARACREQMLSEQRFLRDVRAAYVEFARRTGLNPDPDTAGQAEIEFPSAFLDANGSPRFKMWIPASLVLNDLGAAHLFYREVAERGYKFALRRFLDLTLNSDDVFIDVGAHWGVHSLTAATLLRNQISVLAIEAHPENSTRLRTWVERNQLEADVEVIPLAIGDRKGMAQMRVNGSSMGHSLRAHDSDLGATTSIEVGMATLDQLMTDRAHLRWRRVILKLDVEGYELEALAGARELLSSGRVAAIVWENGEFYEPAVRGERTKTLVDLLNSFGFEHFCMRREGPAMRLVPLRDKNLLGDIFSLAPNFDRKERYA
jgi:FkbM family methyltransferase